MTPSSRAFDEGVTAVLVAHNGATWLPTVLAALAGSTVQPDQLVAVDTGSTDGTAELLRGALPAVSVLPAGTGFGAAVASMLQGRPPTRWLWLLHDDAAPDPSALAALLAHAAGDPSAAMLGPKVRDWADPQVLVEVGLSIDPDGQRRTGLDRGEYDQGQWDDVRTVLAVGTACALVRRDVWDELGGLDPQLPLFRDDVDFGWRVSAAGHRVVVVPSARIRHVRATTVGRRDLAASFGRPVRVDRRHALYVLLSNTSALRLPRDIMLLLLVALARSFVLLVRRRPAAAGDELAAPLAVLARPGRLWSARRRRARSRRVPFRQIRPLLGSGAGRLRARGAALADWAAGGSAAADHPLGALGEGGPDGLDEVLDRSHREPGLLLRAVRNPGVLLTLTLVAVALLAERRVLSTRTGVLFGGRLLPVPPGARDLWADYAASWHAISVGTAADAHPIVGVLAVLATVLLGKPWLAVDLILLASVPLSGAAAYLAAANVTGSRLVRVWVGATWALLPVVTGGLATGRLDVAAAQVALPGLLAAGGRLVAQDPYAAGWRRIWVLGLGLAVTAAFTPLLWPLTGGLLLVGAAAARSLRRFAAAAVVVAVPALLILPWAWDSGLPALLDGPGRSLPAARPGGWLLLLLDPGGPGVPPALITGPVLLAALTGVLLAGRPALALGGWGVAVAGLAAAVGLERSDRWPGVALQVAAAGLLLAAVAAAEGARVALASRAFGRLQVLAGCVAGLAVLTPAWSGAGWVGRGADGPLRRGAQPLLPAYARAELAASPGLRVLVLAPRAGGASYDLTTAVGEGLGAADTWPTPDQRHRLDEVVADVLTPSGSDAAEALATRAVRFIALRAGPGAVALTAGLDAQPGLTRRGSGQILLWRVVAPTARLMVLPPAVAAAALSGERAPRRDLVGPGRPSAIRSGREAADIRIGPGRPGRLMVLAEAADPGWRASYDGAVLPRVTAWGWAQGFRLPAGSGRFLLRREVASRRATLAGQAGGLVLVCILAAPGARRRRDLEGEPS